MSKSENEFLFYMDCVIATRDGIDNILSHYSYIVARSSPQQKYEIDRNIKMIEDFLERHHQEIKERANPDEIPW